MKKGEKTQLPSREAGLFRSIVKFYETKQYKKGLKASDTILKKFPEHGGTFRPMMSRFPSDGPLLHFRDPIYEGADTELPRA